MCKSSSASSYLRQVSSVNGLRSRKTERPSAPNRGVLNLSTGSRLLFPIGVGNGSRRPRPPNRACGSPAHGSPVGGFLIGIGSLASRLYAWGTGPGARRNGWASADDPLDKLPCPVASPAFAVSLATVGVQSYPSI